MNDLPFWALKLESPLTIEAIGDKPHAEIAPASMTAIYEYGARGDCLHARCTGVKEHISLKSGSIKEFLSGELDPFHR